MKLVLKELDYEDEKRMELAQDLVKYQALIGLSCGSLTREPPTGYPKPVSKKQLECRGNQQS
jgi:hypothetical protein